MTRTALVNDPTRGGPVGENVVQPQNPRRPTRAGVYDSRQERRKRRRRGHKDIGTMQHRESRELRAHERKLLPVTLDRCIASDPERQAKHRDSVARLPIGKHPGPPHRLRIVRVGRHHFDLVPTVTQPFRPCATHRTDAGRLRIIVVAPELDVHKRGNDSTVNLRLAALPCGRLHRGLR